MEVPTPKIRVVIDRSCDVRGIERMSFGHNVVVQRDCWLNIAFDHPRPGPMLTIGQGTNIGRRSTISAANRIAIGNFVLVGPNVFITDTQHAYQDIHTPIMLQGISTSDAQVSIGDGSWLGINSVVMGNITIGKNCVVGANTVVNRDIPDYCVVVGNPARIVKIHDTVAGTWVSVRTPDEVEAVLAARSGNGP